VVAVGEPATAATSASKPKHASAAAHASSTRSRRSTHSPSVGRSDERGGLDYARVLEDVLRDVGSSASSGSAASNVSIDATPIVSLLRQVASSSSFRHHASSRLSRQVERGFLVQALGQFVSSGRGVPPTNNVLKNMKAQMDSRLARMFGFALPGAAPTAGKGSGPARYQVNMFGNAKQARMFVLQYALHKKAASTPVPTATPASSSSSSRKSASSNDPAKSSRKSKSSSNSSSSSSSSSPFVLPSRPACPSRPTFYLSEGSPLFASRDRFAWELLLPRECMRVVPVKRVSGGDHQTDDEDELGVPTYTMDLAALESMLLADLRFGCTPTAVFVTLGSDVQADGAGGAGAGRAGNFQHDDLVAAHAIATKHGLWVHVEGTAVLLAAATGDPAAGRARAVFGLADSVSTEVLGWFDMSGSMTVSFFKVDPVSTVAPSASTATPATPIVAPPTPLSRDVVGNLFLLWFQLVSHSEDFVGEKVRHLLSAGRALRQRLARPDMPFPVLLGPGDAEADQFPQYVFVQLGPTRSVHLDEFMLDINTFNAYMFSRLASCTPEPFAAREEQEEEEEGASRSRSRSRSASRSRTPSPSPSPDAPADDEASSPEPAAPVESGDENGGGEGGNEAVEAADSSDSNLPLSSSARRSLLSFLTSSASLSLHRGRLGILVHLLSGPSTPCTLRSTLRDEHVELLVRAVREEMNHLVRARSWREGFKRALDDQAELEFVPREDLAPLSSSASSSATMFTGSFAGAGAGSSETCYGIGAFRYKPEFDVTEEQRDRLNQMLAQSLARKNNLVSREEEQRREGEVRRSVRVLTHRVILSLFFSVSRSMLPVSVYPVVR
jgi:hypothetical protein